MDPKKCIFDQMRESVTVALQIETPTRGRDSAERNLNQQRDRVLHVFANPWFWVR
jgi:hypothetical protein